MSSPYTIKHWINKGFTEEESKIEILKRRPSNVLYWINKGFTEEEAKIKVFNHQSMGGKSHKGNEEFRKKCNTTLEYWINKGFTEEEAKIKQKERQTTFTLQKCIETYGTEEGTRIWQQRQDKWQRTINSKSSEEQNRINKNKGMTLNDFIKKYGIDNGLVKYKDKCVNSSPSLETKIRKYGEVEGVKRYNEWYNNILKSKKYHLFSKESMKIFDPICLWLSDIGYEGKIYTALTEYNELKLFESKGKIKRCFFYDFALTHPRIIIEYNGEAFHPNPQWEQNIWNNWKQPYSNKTADDVFEYQENKIRIARDAKFKVLEIWSSTPISDNIEKCKEFIKNEINMFNKTSV